MYDIDVEVRNTMKWTMKDLDIYLREREYVDTALIPLIPITLSQNVKMTAAMSEFIQVITGEMERQFKGRVLLFPPFTYLAQESLEMKKERLDHWTSELTENGIKHVFYITSDFEWKTAEKQLEGALLLLPVVPLEHMDEKYKHQLVSDQVSQLINVFVEKWS